MPDYSNLVLLKDQLLNLLKDLILREATEKLASQFPIFFTGPLGFIGNAVLKKIVFWGIENLSIFAEIQIAGFTTRKELHAVQAVIKKAKEMQSIMTDEERMKLDEALQVASFKLIHLNR